MNKKTLKEGINLYQIKTEKFKTFSVTFYFTRPLLKEEASLNALIPYIIRRGSANFPDNEAISAALEEMYGGTFDCFVKKKGDCHITGFSFEFVSPGYVREEAYKEKVFDFIFDVVFDPKCENGGFVKETVEREKKNQIDFINGIINDKKEYASVRCVEEMFKGEAYAIYSGGCVEDIMKADEKTLYRQYLKLISSSPIDIFVSGNIETEEIEKRLLQIERKSPVESFEPCSYKKHTGEVKRVTDKLSVNQGKLCIGFVTNTDMSDKAESAALTVFNSVFGSGAHSKLFNNVREKLSLCYYAASRVNKFKGIMSVSSGVEFENFDKAYEEILIQLESVKRKEIEDREMEAAKFSIINALKSYSDNPAATEEFYFSRALAGLNETVEEFIEEIKNVTADEVAAIASKIELDTVYKLTGKED